VDEELKDMTSVLLELTCIRDGYVNLHFDDSMVWMFVHFICWHWCIFYVI